MTVHNLGRIGAAFWFAAVVIIFAGPAPTWCMAVFAVTALGGVCFVGAVFQSEKL